MGSTESIFQNLGNAIQGRRIGVILVVFACLISPALAATNLPLGAPNTTPGSHPSLPNQFGFSNVTIYNLSSVSANFTFGNIEYPPLYESNPDIVPWELWVVFFLLGVAGAFLTFKIPREEPAAQLVAAVIGIAFSSYSFVLSALVGFTTVTSNAQGFILTEGATDYAVMVNVIQPVYTVYSPPYFWAILLAVLFISIGGLINGTYNLLMKVAAETKNVRDIKGKPPRYGVGDLGGSGGE